VFRARSAEFTIGGNVNAAFRLLTKALADRGVKDGVRVNAINPGFIKTERLETRLKTFAQENNLPPGAAGDADGEGDRRREVRRAVRGRRLWHFSHHRRAAIAKDRCSTSMAARRGRSDGKLRRFFDDRSDDLPLPRL
jgi:NAD(P)-dependent dehydrogenase (short-subunit alcohol dehydrogenase family)